MKTRTDFVSNSSSCSFVINDIKKTVQCLKSINGDGYIPSEFDELNLRIYAKRSVLKELLDALDQEPSYYDNFTRDLYIEDSYDFTLSQLENIPDELLQKISSIYITCDDYEQDKVMYLSVLYMFLKNEGVDVDCSDSERDLMFQEGDTSFLGKLLKKAFK